MFVGFRSIRDNEVMAKKPGDKEKQVRKLGTFLPESTKDDTEADWGESTSSRDQELKDNVPPHH